MWSRKSNNESMLKETAKSDVEVDCKIVSVCVQLKISVTMMLMMMKHTLKKLQAFLPLTPNNILDIVCFYFQVNAFWETFLEQSLEP